MRPILTFCASLGLLAACDTTGLDLDMRDVGRGFDTTAAVQSQTAARPEPDSRGVISYPNYQVAIARQGDTVTTVAERLGLPPAEMARYNGIPPAAQLNAGEVLALPSRVPEAAGSALTSPGSVDIETLAGDAINRAGGSAAGANALSQTGAEPVRHKVEAGETAYSIARLYGVSARSIGEWNGLGPDLGVRQGQYLMIPVVVAAPAAVETATNTTEPGVGSPTPTPPSASTPLPEERTEPVAEVLAAADDPSTISGLPESPDLGSEATSASASNAAMVYPVQGSIIRDFNKGRNDGIDIRASAGSTVKAAAAGTVAAITEDTEDVPIMVLRHADGLMTIYANIDGLKVSKGQSVSRGQAIAQVRSSSSPYLHFEVRDGVEAVDPAPYLK
ncbi:LysM peptidoglycan-binding domain-containing M23 family metallopeptidase [Tropicimonas sp. TH_r6]|uniref:LysM peptidoglycan-binding domain-containing M23 family metallopeptidase n=1 Tax=Tropicimonas sp. TH_r6 TaxID=3082085 RepID=UPI00295379E6|nr:LysM peptidoglycan-binding domain-containing M23 family metallopeptidase [Tropicimonas sp. TH_r6]MDV7142082.1 LysM peptidoglycan-binding domain-containing M23 family metallopeptidase [Tropicimonas sp. TH_r6]